MIVRQCEEILRRAQRRSADGIATVRLGVSILYPRPPHPRPMAARCRQAHRHPPGTGVDARRLRSDQRHRHPPRRGRRSDTTSTRSTTAPNPATCSSPNRCGPAFTRSSSTWPWTGPNRSSCTTDCSTRSMQARRFTHYGISRRRRRSRTVTVQRNRADAPA